MSTPARTFLAPYLIGAVVVGTIGGIGSLATTPEGRAILVAKSTDLGVATGIARARSPQSGDRWGGCDDARAAGTAPIYRGESGYRGDMDGDSDGIACEPYS